MRGAGRTVVHGGRASSPGLLQLRLRVQLSQGLELNRLHSTVPAAAVATATVDTSRMAAARNTLTLRNAHAVSKRNALSFAERCPECAAHRLA